MASRGQAPNRPKSGKFPRPRGRGFASAGQLLRTRIAKAGESRGFSVARLLTHWTEVVGPDMARLCAPHKVGFSRKGGLGATLTLQVVGAAGPLVQAQSEQIRAQVNACYGYNAIAKIRLLQSGARPGFGEAQAPYRAPEPALPAQPPEAVTARTETVTDPDLRAALDRLGTLIHTHKPRG